MNNSDRDELLTKMAALVVEISRRQRQQETHLEAIRRKVDDAYVRSTEDDLLRLHPTHD